MTLPATPQPGAAFAAAGVAMAAGKGSREALPPKKNVSAAAEAAPAATGVDDTQISDATNPAASEAVDETAQQGTDAVDAADQQPGQDDDQQPDGDTGRTFTVQVDGKAQQVAESELIAGYQRNADYIRKSQEVAQGRKEVEKLKGETSTTRNQLTKELGMLRQVLASQLPTEETMRKALAENRSADYLQMQKQWQDFKVIVDRVEGLGQQQNSETAEQKKGRLNSEMTLLTDKQPEFAQPETQQAVAQMLLDDGFPREEVSQLSDHRHLIIAYQALQYRNLMSRGHAAHQEVKKLPAMAKPAARQTAVSGDKQLVAQGTKLLAQTGRVPDSMKGLVWGRHIKQ